MPLTERKAAVGGRACGQSVTVSGKAAAVVAFCFTRVERRCAVVRYQLVLLAVVAVLYLANKTVMQGAVQAGAWPAFAASYLNDLMAPIALYALSNICYSWWKVQVTALGSMLVLTLIASLVWELLAPQIFAWSVSDPFDVVAYFAGTLVYWLLCRVGPG